MKQLLERIYYLIARLLDMLPMIISSAYVRRQNTK